MTMTLLCVATCVAIVAILIRCLGFIGAPAWRALTKWQRVLGCICIVMMALFLLRPHEHVFQGLDSSGYRLMTKALESGRALSGQDQVLLELPQSLRVHSLLLPHMHERNTRDRSFEIKSLDTAAYQPFFYPLLPMAMHGLDVLVPGPAADYFTPFFSLLFCGTLLLWALSRMGWLACLAVPALLLASPLPAWLMRGCYVETISGVLLATALLVWLDSERTRTIPLSTYLALGLAVSFHPVMAIPAICIAGPMLMTEQRFARITLGMVMGLLGLLPIILLTLWVCQPYGALTLRNLAYGVKNSASIQSAVVGAAIAAVVAMVFVSCRGPFMRAIARAQSGVRGSVLSLALVLLAVAPTWLAATVWGQRDVVRQGLIELESGLNVAGSIGLALLGLVALLRRRQSALGILAVGLSLPVFLYLKGAEQMGLWSQRRLIAPYLLYITAVTPAFCWLAGRIMQAGRLRLIRVVALMVATILLGIGNAIGHVDKWIAPYQIQYERGADAWVAKQREAIGTRLTLSDAYGYTLPLAVDGKTRIVGLGEKAMKVLPDVMTWLGERARAEEVLWFTSCENPGMEDGLVLVPYQPAVTQVFWRARAKWALPAIRERIVVRTQLLRVLPLSTTSLPVMDKLMDPGVLGLRAPWGSSDIPISLPGGTKLPARWSREGSGIVGPVPPPGASVRITVDAVNARVDDIDEQTLLIHAPWGGDPLALPIARSFSTVSAVLCRTNPVTDTNALSAATGVYRIHSSHPYDPAKANIRNFNRDLGALIHRIRIEVVVMDQP